MNFNIMAMRAQYKDVFEKKHGSKLGLMGFFTKACVQALKDIPAANAEIDGTHRSTRITTTSALRSAPTRAWWCRWSAIADSKSIAGIPKRASPISGGGRATAS